MSASLKYALRGFIIKKVEQKLTKPLLPPEKFKPKKIKRILIICGNERLHEVILSFPAFKAIRKKFPKAKITALFEGEFADLKAQFNVCDEVKPFYRRLIDWPVKELSEFIKMIRTGFDFVIVFNTNGHFYMDAILAHFCKAKYILGSKLALPKREAQPEHFERYTPYNLLAPAPKNLNHPSSYYRSVLRVINIKRYHSVNRLPITESVKQNSKNILHYNGIKPNELMIGISLTPEKNEKPWPIENYVELARHFRTRMEAQVLVFCNPEDSKTVAKFESGLPFKPFRVDEYELIKQASIMQHCGLMICANIDCMYLAYSVGTQTIGLFGSLEEKLWKPGNDKFIAINSENEDITKIKTKKVIDTAKKVLRTKIFDKGNSLDISEQVLDDYLDFGDIVENI